MKKILLLLALLTTLTASIRSQDEELVLELPNCAFSNSSTMTQLGAIILAAEFYVQHNRWPESIDEVRVMNIEGISKEKIDSMISKFKYYRLKKEKKNLILSYSFSENSNLIQSRIRMKPKQTIDEIIQSVEEL